jgi:hypothetical protein
LESAVAKVRQKSYGDHFWAFIHEKPEWVAATAFGIGMVAGKLTNGASLKHIKALSPEFANPVSQLAQAALKYLPGHPAFSPEPGRPGRPDHWRRPRAPNHRNKRAPV